MPTTARPSPAIAPIGLSMKDPPERSCKKLRTPAPAPSGGTAPLVPVHGRHERREESCEHVPAGRVPDSNEPACRVDQSRWRCPEGQAMNEIVQGSVAATGDEIGEEDRADWMRRLARALADQLTGGAPALT